MALARERTYICNDLLRETRRMDGHAACRNPIEWSHASQLASMSSDLSRCRVPRRDDISDAQMVALDRVTVDAARQANGPALEGKWRRHVIIK